MYKSKIKTLLILVFLIVQIGIFSGCQNESYSVDSQSQSQESSEIQNEESSQIQSQESSEIQEESSQEQMTTSKSTNDSESLIKTALLGKSAEVFQISDDITFNSDTPVGVFTKSVNGATTSTEMTLNQAQGCITHFLYNKTIRIDSGVVSIDDNDFKCILQILPGDQGVSINITRGNSLSVNQGHLQGVIKGNTLYAKAEATQQSLVNGIGNGYSASGEFNVSIIKLSADQLPPIAPANLTVTENSDHSMKLTWEDLNPSGLVEYYDVYRTSGIVITTSKIATISNCTSWDDTSDVAKTENNILSYYIIAHAKNGKESTMSNLGNFNALNRLLNPIN